MNQTNPVGPAKSLKVYAGDKVDMEVYGYYENTSGYGSSNNTTAVMITAIAGAFGGVNGGAGESGSIYNGVNAAIGGFGLGSNPGDASPAAFINYILYDLNYKVLDMGWTRIPSGAMTKSLMTIPQVTAKETGYIFVYLTYEDQSNNYVYFDDFTVTHTKTNVIQSNEYYAHGMPTANSWTRDNVMANSFLGNGGTELNSTSQLYDLDYRNFDPALARLNQVDPLADKFSSLSPYHFAYNNPTVFTDPSGAKPWSQDFAESYVGDDYGARNAFAKMVAHNQLAGWVGGAGEGWNYVGHYDLDAAGYGFGAMYANPNSIADSWDRANKIVDGINAALDSKKGGSIDVSKGIVSFYDKEGQSWAAGYTYNELHNSWNQTEVSREIYSVGMDLNLQDMKYMIAYQGPGDGITIFSNYNIEFTIGLQVGLGAKLPFGVGDVGIDVNVANVVLYSDTPANNKPGLYTVSNSAGINFTNLFGYSIGQTQDINSRYSSRNYRTNETFTVAGSETSIQKQGSQITVNDSQTIFSLSALLGITITKKKP